MLQNSAKDLSTVDIPAEQLVVVKAKAVQITAAVKKIQDLQKYVRLGIQRDSELAMLFASDAGDLDLTDAENKKLEALEKARQSKRSTAEKRSSDGGSSGARYKKLDKSKDVCHVCGKMGHWWSDPECKGASKA